MKKIVKGNDFTLKIPVMKMVEGQAQDFPLPACTDIVVQVCNQFKRIPLAFEIDVKEDNVLLARVEGDKMSLGTYAIEVKGKIFGNDWRSNEYPQFYIVANNADSDTEFGETDEGDNSVEMDTAMVILPPSVELSDLISDTNEALGKVDGAVSKTDEAVKKANDALSQVNGALEKVQNVDIDIDGTNLNITRPSGEKKEFDLMQLKGDKGERGEKGDKGNAFTFADFTPEELASLKGEKGDKGDKGLQGERGEQGLPGNDGAKGDKGEAFKYTDFTEEQLAALKGDKGDIGLTGPQGEIGPVGPQGVKGDPFTYSDFTEEQIKELQKPATDAANKAQEILKKAETATAGAEKVDATLANDVLTVTNRNGESTSLQLASYAEVVDVVSEVKHLSETMGAYSDRPDITLVAKETNKAISADGIKVAKTGWAIAEFTAEKGNIYLFKPNEVDSDVCIFAEEITNIETRGIDYTYTYNAYGNIETAKATYLGETHTYTFTYAEDKSYTIIDESGETVEALPMTYETKVGSYSPLVRLNADAELPIDGYCRYMSHFKGNSSIKIVVSYKIDAADLVMKVVRDGVFASISTQLGNLSKKEDETRKKIEELHGNWVDLLFKKDWTISIDNSSLNIKGCKKTRVYPKSFLNLNGSYNKFTPLVWADISNLKDLDGMTYRFTGGLQGCAYLKTIYANGTDVRKFTSLCQFFDHCTALQSIDVSTWDVGNVTDFRSMFSNCYSLQSIDVSAWDMSKATNLARMFGSCTSLKSIDVSEWNVGNVTSLTSMFYSCKNLQSIDVSAWDVSNVTSIDGMFYDCGSLGSIDVSNWDVRKLKTFTGFLQQNKIKSLDLSGWDLESCTNLSFTEYSLPWVTLKLGHRFFHCPNVTSANWTGLSSWTDASVKESLVTNSYDRRENGLPDLTLTLHANTKNVLSEDDIAAMTAKGYIIA